MRQPVSITPWRSIREGAVGVRDSTLSVPEAMAGSPCATCSTSPCCTHLPIHTFAVTDLSGLSYAGYLLNFERIRLGLGATGEWQAYYVQPCRHLDRELFTCGVHDTPEQPQICVTYNPYTCWYKRTLTADVTEEFLVVDRSRLAVLEAMVRVDDLRRIVEFPAFEELVEAFAGVSDEPADLPEPPRSDPGWEGWQAVVLGEKPPDAPAAPVAYEELANPCDGCSAPCCTTLTFPQGIPASRSNLDFYRFCLGFPGVELTLSDDGWWLTVTSECRHLDGNRCSVYGQPERPLVCRYYDEWKCTYKAEFAAPRPDHALRIRYEHFDALAGALGFDAAGGLVSLPPVAELRSVVEERWRHDLTASPA